MREFQELKQDIANHREFREGEQDTWFEEFKQLDYADVEARQMALARGYGMGPKGLLQYTGSDAQRMRAAAAEITAKREARRDRVLSLLCLAIGVAAVVTAIWIGGSF